MVWPTGFGGKTLDHVAASRRLQAAVGRTSNVADVSVTNHGMRYKALHVCRLCKLVTAAGC